MTTATASTVDSAAIDELIERAREAFGVPGAAVTVIKDAEVVYQRGIGVRNQESGAPVTPDTIFPIASTTKAFTTTALAMQVDEGKLSWDDLVRDHLPTVRLQDPAADQNVTMRDLVSHRTGMPRHDLLWVALEGDTSDLIRRYGRATPSTSFRSTWEYANVPFTTAGVISGYLDGTDWSTVMRERIFSPLGMNATTCHAAEAQARDDHATTYHQTLAGDMIATDYDPIDWIGGAGAIKSSARDMAQWLCFQLASGQLDDTPLLSQDAFRETHKPFMILRPDVYFAPYFPIQVTNLVAYGLGWFVHDYRGQRVVSHGGTLTGLRAQTLLIPDAGIGVFAVTNLEPTSFPEAITKAIADHLLRQDTEDWIAFYLKVEADKRERALKTHQGWAEERVAATSPSLALDAYAGAYIEPAYGDAEVALEGDNLTIRWGKLTFRLDHHHYNTFTATVIEPVAYTRLNERAVYSAHFGLDKYGKVATMRYLDQEFGRKA